MAGLGLLAYERLPCKAGPWLEMGPGVLGGFPHSQYGYEWLPVSKLYKLWLTLSACFPSRGSGLWHELDRMLPPSSQCRPRTLSLHHALGRQHVTRIPSPCGRSSVPPVCLPWEETLRGVCLGSSAVCLMWLFLLLVLICVLSL